MLTGSTNGQTHKTLVITLQIVYNGCVWMYTCSVCASMHVCELHIC